MKKKKESSNQRKKPVKAAGNVISKPASLQGFLKINRKLLNISGIEKKSGMAAGELRHVLRGHRRLSANQFKKLQKGIGKQVVRFSIILFG